MLGALILLNLPCRSSYGRPQHGKIPIDIWLHLRCRTSEYRCVTAKPELFHDHEKAGAMQSLIGGQSDEVIIQHAQTVNILQSARCNA